MKTAIKAALREAWGIDSANALRVEAMAMVEALRAIADSPEASDLVGAQAFGSHSMDGCGRATLVLRALADALSSTGEEGNDAG